MANQYIEGQLVRLSAVFKNAAGVAADPTAVTVTIEAPSGDETVYIYGTHAQLVKDSTGTYHVDVSADEPGTWYWRMVGTGAVETAEQDTFIVAPAQP